MKRRQQDKSSVRIVQDNDGFRHPSSILFLSDKHSYSFVRKENWGKREMFIYKCITEISDFSGKPSTKLGLELPIEKEELEKYINGKSFIKVELYY